MRSELTLSLKTEKVGYLRFTYKVDSEFCCDGLAVYVDGAKVLPSAANNKHMATVLQWTPFVFPLHPGFHTVQVGAAELPGCPWSALSVAELSLPTDIIANPPPSTPISPVRLAWCAVCVREGLQRLARDGQGGDTADRGGWHRPRHGQLRPVRPGHRHLCHGIHRVHPVRRQHFPG